MKSLSPLRVTRIPLKIHREQMHQFRQELTSHAPPDSLGQINKGSQAKLSRLVSSPHFSTQLQEPQPQ
jgi:hypothetical protein